MKCPVCENVDLTMADRQGVEIDYCPKCRGVWLDRGELDKIIDRTSAVAPQATPGSGGGHHSGHGSHGYGSKDSAYRGKKKKSMLSELFDF